MADGETPETVSAPPFWRRAITWVVAAIAAIIALIALALLLINTSPGRRFLANRIAAYTTASGLNISIGRIEGSIYSAMVLKDVRVRDTKGVFLTSPEIDVDWRPFAFVNSHVDVRSATSKLITMARTPVLKPTPSEPNQPLLPDIDIDVNGLKVDYFVLGPAVTGAKRIVRIAGAVHIADRRAQITAQAAALSAPGVIGGDRLQLRLDAVPNANRLAIDADLQSPQDGIVGSMSGVKQPLAFAVHGTGDWKAWDGKALGTLGGKSLVDVAIAARNGTFKLRGTAHPGLYMAGPVERLTAPQLAIALDTTLGERRADTVLALRSDALALDATGALDLGKSQFGNVQVDARLLTPGAVAPQLSAKDAAVHLALDGPFATPSVDYVISARQIGFGATGLEQLYATGTARVNADRILIPVHAHAAKVTGLNAVAGDLLTKVTIDGDLAIAGSQVLSDNLHLKSNRIDATAIIAADLAKGRYTGALKGRVNDYRIESLGVLNLITDAKLVGTPSGGWGIRGHVVARTQQIFNESARNFLGGNAVLSSDIGYDTSGVVTISNLKVAAPQFRVVKGSGQYQLSGALRFDADAVSTQYGPISLSARGSATNPDIVLRAAHPGFGIGLADLVAHVRGRQGAYAALARGNTDYGPFNADVVISPGTPMTVAVNKLLFAGVDFHGKLAATASGPFAGTLDFSGSGLSGKVTLAAAGKAQRADVAAHAYHARIPAKVDFTIGRALINATAILYPQGPAIKGDAQVADLHYGPSAIAKARATIDYANQKGSAQLVASGSNGVPFNLALNARLAPEQWLVALKGDAAGIKFQTANPARISHVAQGYQLGATRLDFNQGSLRLAGIYGNAPNLHLRLDKLDLSVVNAFVPGLEIGGAATGRVDLTMPSANNMPEVDALISIDNFTRSGVATVSSPVDITLKGTMHDGTADMRALVKRGGTAIGRLVATLHAGEGSNWTTRMADAPLSGGIRYNGPAAVLFSLSGLAKQQLTGPIAVAADFSGALGAPRINGIVRADNLTYDNEVYGTRLTNMAIRGRFTNDRFELTSLNATAGDGTLKAQGSVGLAAASGFPIDVTASFDRARLARGQGLAATTTGTLKVHHDKTGGAITGDLSIPQARYQIVMSGAADVPVLEGVRRKGQSQENAATGQAATPIGLFRLNIRLHADNELFVSGMGLDSEWSADLRVRGTSASPRVIGEARVVRGTYSFAGKRFTLDRGIVHFEGGPMTDPTLDISASTSVNGIEAVINITGSGQHPQVAFTSTPTLPQDEVLSRLLFGDSPENLSAIQAVQLAAALNSLRGTGGGLNPLGTLRSATGIDRLEVLGADEATGRQTAVSAGKYITNDVYVSLITDARGFTATQLEVSLTRALSVLSQTGSFGGSSVSVRYKKDY